MPCRDFYGIHHGCRPQILIPYWAHIHPSCWSNIWLSICIRSVSWWSIMGPEKTADVNKKVPHPKLTLLLLIAFLANPGVWRLLHFLDLNPCPLSIWRSPDLICDLLTDFIFLIKALFNMRILLWQFSLILRSDHFKWSCFKWNYAHLAFSLFLQKGGLQSGSSETKVFL